MAGELKAARGFTSEPSRRIALSHRTPRGSGWAEHLLKLGLDVFYYFAKPAIEFFNLAEVNEALLEQELFIVRYPVGQRFWPTRL